MPLIIHLGHFGERKNRVGFPDKLRTAALLSGGRQSARTVSDTILVSSPDVFQVGADNVPFQYGLVEPVPGGGVAHAAFGESVGDIGDLVTAQIMDHRLDVRLEEGGHGVGDGEIAISLSVVLALG
jgi:hypothetical protein